MNEELKLMERIEELLSHLSELFITKWVSGDVVLQVLMQWMRIYRVRKRQCSFQIDFVNPPKAPSFKLISPHRRDVNSVGQVLMGQSEL